jgi:hypothetical protein
MGFVTLMVGWERSGVTLALLMGWVDFAGEGCASDAYHPVDHRFTR